MPFRSNPCQGQQNQSTVDEHRVQALQLGVMSPELVTAMSVVEITSTLIYDQQTFQPNFHAINDPRMGVMDNDSRCFTCKQNRDTCPGHFGHIVLHSPVYHPGLLVYIVKFLKVVCFNCSKLLVLKDADQQKCDAVRETLLKIRNPKSRFKTLQKLTGSVHVCSLESGGCGYKQPKFLKGSLKVEVEFKDENFDQTRDRKSVLWPEETLRVLQKISDEDCKLMGLNPVHARPNWAIIKNLAVAPPPVRPSVSLGGNMRSEDDLTYCYQQVLKINNILKEQVEKGANMTIINELKQSLQYYVSTLMDNKIAGQPVQKHKSGKPIKCIRSRLKGKEGRLRGNLMGKRVDFSSRTVITPDPNLRLDELGVPYKVAQGLTVPESVTPQNIDKLRLLVNNGPSLWPGAKYIIRHDGRQIDLSVLRNRSDVHIEVGYIVERHLQDGDYVMFNRQPSLHKMSIMGHRVKVLPYSTFRMNLSVTTPYNADFDGDEMNMHVPQSLETMAEIKELMLVQKQILAPQANKPCMGIVQDSLLGSMKMTDRDTFIDKELAMQLLMWMPDKQFQAGQFRLPTPAILKPKPLWSGKQIFSMIIPKVNLMRFKKTFCCSKDSTILIDQGELLCGALNKSIIGATSQGLNHIILKDFDEETCADFLSAAQKITNNWLIQEGFTVGVQDIIVQEKAVADGIKQILEKYKRSVNKIISQSQSGQLKSQPGKSMQESFEVQVNKRLNDARDKSGNLALDGLVSSNRLRTMVIAGSKGSNINISQIMACVGQQNVEGGRIPFGFSRRTLPHFSKDDFGPESKGFVESSYLSGLNPDELYFHAMGGREGLIDTAVKTAETGYISRRLIKALEDIMVAYDGTVRTSKQELVQFLYGEDGMAGEQIEDLSIDLIKLSNKQITDKCLFPTPGSSETIDRQIKSAITEQNILQILRSDTQTKAMQDEFKQLVSDRDELRTSIFKTTLEDSVHLPVNVAKLIWNAKSSFGIRPRTQTVLTPHQVVTKVNDLINGLQVVAEQSKVDSNLNAKKLFAIQLRYLLCSKNVILNERITAPALEWLLAEIKSKFEQSIVCPGEMVGAIAAQSLGEPATQMTLNTFHFAGISAKNVTLGVPRFKEIINVTKNIKTPSLKIFLDEDYRTKQNKVAKLGMLIEYTTLCHVVSSSCIFYDPEPDKTIVFADRALVQLYNDVPVLEEQAVSQRPNPWLLRLEMDREKMEQKGLRMSQIDKKLSDTFANQISIMVSDDNSENHVMRIRLNNIEDDEETTVASFLKNEFEPTLLNELALKGFPEIQKVTFTKNQETSICPKTGEILVQEDSWAIETDGSALAKILTIPKVDATRTITNDNLEVLEVLGVEAARMSLVNEMRFVLSSYGIYVNYRHISTLVDVMSLRGKLTSITRSGINRVDSGVLRKCTFEETVEILLEGATFSEKDPLTGISENIIVGQLGPFGSGAFGLHLNPQVIEDHARAAFNMQGVLEMPSDYLPGGDTPFAYDAAEDRPMTPMISMTPGLNGMMTPASLYPMTPQTGAFSPRHEEIMAGFNGSPYYQSPSPIYGVNNSSPLYKSGFYQPNSPGYQRQSPNYQGSLASEHYAKPQSPVYRADQGLGAYQSPAYAGQSPIYGNPSHLNAYAGPNAVASPSYSPNSGAFKTERGRMGAMSQNKLGSSYSPSYNPASGFNPGSAQKSNMSPSYYMPLNSSPAIKFENSGYNMSSASAVGKSPAYNPQPFSYTGALSARDPNKIKEEPLDSASESD